MCILFLNVSDNKTARTLHNRCNDNISNNVAKFVIMVFMLQVEDFCEPRSINLFCVIIKCREERKYMHQLYMYKGGRVGKVNLINLITEQNF